MSVTNTSSPPPGTPRRPNPARAPLLPLWTPGSGYTPPQRNGALKNTAHLRAAILDRLRQGVPLAVIAREPGMPAAFTIRRWREADPRFAEAVHDARWDGYEVLTEAMKAEGRANITLLGKKAANRIFQRRLRELDRMEPKPLPEPRAGAR